METLDDEMCISFAFPGAFRARLLRDGAVVEADASGLAGVFRGLAAGAYTLEVDEDDEQAVAAVAYVAPTTAGGLARKTEGGAAGVTAELRAMTAEQLAEAGPEYQRLLAARDAEDILSGT